MIVEQLEEGTVLNGRYRILRPLGKGGMGTVYMAEHVRLDAIVAVKEVRRQSAGQDADRLDFDGCESEARMLFRLNHPHLPKVTDAFIEEDRFYLVMEYIEGVTLESLLKEGDGRLISVQEVVEWALQIADVLAYLHHQDPPVIFRDMKPANVMLQPDGVIRLIDFGIARRFQIGAMKDTALLGSVGYSPPEQFGKQQTDGRSDIYAFGATLHHLLTRCDPMAQPFKFPQARSLNPLVPESLSMLLTWCLQMEPEARPADVGIVVQRLREIQEEIERLPAPPVPIGPPAQRPAPNAYAPVRTPAGAPARVPTSQRKAPEFKPIRDPYATSHLEVSRTARFILVGLLILIMGVGTLALLREHRNRPHPSNIEVTLPPIVPPSPSVPHPAPAPIVPPSPPDPTPGPIDPSKISVSVSPPISEQNEYLLPVQISGILQGHANSQVILAVYFQTEDGKALFATDKNSVFANSDGQLSKAVQFNALSDNQTISQVFHFPLRLFPPGALAGGLKYYGLISVDGQRIYSEITELPALSLPDSLAPQEPAVSGDGSTPSGANGAGGGRDSSGASVVGGR